MSTHPEGATQELQSKRGIVGEDDNRTPVPETFGSRTKAAWKFVRPAVDKTTSFALTFFIIIMVLWELDDALGGSIYTWAGWLRLHLLKRFPIVPLLLGMYAYHKFRQIHWRSKG